MSLEFTTAKRRKKPIPFTLDGEKYSFTPQKSAGIVLAAADDDETAMLRATFDWLGEGLPEAQRDKIMDRLRDPEDDLDIDTLQQIIQKLQEESAGRPTS